MHAKSLVYIALLSFAASSWAISVEQPSENATWSSSGPNTVQWTSVNTDPILLDIALVQNSQSVKVLANNVSTSLGQIVITQSLPTGAGFQVNMLSTTNGGILAQSKDFSIVQGGSSSTASSTTGTSTGTGTTSTTGTTTGASATGTSPATAPDSSSTATSIPTQSNAASLSTPTHTSLMGILALFGLALF